MGKIFIVHFQPLEKYPPVINMLRHLAAVQTHGWTIHAISTEAGNEKKLLKVAGITIHRVCKWRRGMSRINRLLFYVRFQVRALSLLRMHQPEKVLYYETLSAGAPFLYKNWYNQKSKLYIHYHEYTSPAEYKQGMFVARWLHRLEKRIYKKAVWVSHTNLQRARLFTEDIGSAAPAEIQAIPNYPPLSWKQVSASITDRKSDRIGFVYVGALSLETMHVASFADFIARNPLKYYWDIYSDNFSPEVISFFERRNAPNIFFQGGVEYDDLPAILPHYDIGVILYKGHIPNYIYNAPNKLFEYLAAGLDVWFPREMEGCAPYKTYKTYPEVLEIDFQQLNIEEVIPGQHKTGYSSGQKDFYFEESVLPLANQLLIAE
jgi:hypothetical protein